MLGDVAQMPSDLRRHKFDLGSEDDASISRSGVVKLTIDIPSSHRPQVAAEPHPPRRWRTPEFIFYGLVFCIVVPMLVWSPISLSSPAHPNYSMYQRRLSRGWLFGRRLDNSDIQYRSFRNNLLSLVLLASASLGLKHLYIITLRHSRDTPRPSRSYLIPYLVTFSTFMIAGLHGTSILKVFLIISVNYAIAKSTKGSKLNPLLTWVFNAVVLFTNERNDGYRYAALHPSLEILDTVPGIYPRWHISFNITMLRLVSFNMDYYWTCNEVGPSDPGSTLTEKQRCAIPHTLETYSYMNYIAYILYPPLYIAGPIMTFNDFMWQLYRPLTIPMRGRLAYLSRFVVCFLTMEFILHFMYVVAIKDTKAWGGDTAAQLSMIGFWNLIIVWLKLLIPWRFFRLWALADGIDPPENMVRCMANNYSTLGFWRAWHRSYNLWIIRYIYIPLGGTKNVAFTSLLIFSFVALWHDLSFRLLAWGWLVTLFILPELTARYILHPSKYGSSPWYRHICAIGAVFNILMMMAANLVGFVIGTDGVSYMLQQLLGTAEGFQFLLFVCICLFVAVQVMFEYREEELRQGIVRRC